MSFRTALNPQRNPNPHTATHTQRAVKIDAQCPHCSSDIWFKRPSGVTYCAACGAPYVPAEPKPERP